MAMYEREYSRGQYGFSETKDESTIISFVKDTYKLFAASMLAGAVGAYVGLPIAETIKSNMLFIYIPWLLFGIFGLNMIKNKPGINMIGLFGFTFVSGLIITPLLTHILKMSGGETIIINAFLMTSVLFGSLSFFAIKSREDFTKYWKTLIITFFIAIIFSIVNILFFHNPILFVLVQVAFLFIISFLVIIDTQNILQGNFESPIDGAVQLYLDFFNIFITLLQLFGIFEKE
jgi:modulator of FtsH protease